MRLTAALACLIALAFFAAPAAASICYAFVEGVPGVRYAALEAPAAAPAAAPVTATDGSRSNSRSSTRSGAPSALAQAVAPVARIMYVGHSAFRIESPEGVAAVTDFFGSAGPGPVPDIVTMNNAHSSHWTPFPDPEIAHVLRGWNPTGDGPAEHKLRERDMVVRNVTTDLRNFRQQEDGNSIFVFEVADLCIGHLGHLHHPLSEEQYALLGRMDVLMMPIDGTFTMNLGQMIDIAKRLKSSIVLPMHAFGQASLNRFLAGMADVFQVREHGTAVLEVALDRLPAEPTVIVMDPVRFSRPPDLD